MSKVPAELVDLLQALFDQGELSRALEREDWSVELVKHLRPVEYETSDAWFHGVVRLAAQRDELPELLAVVQRLRSKRAAEIEAVGRLLEKRAAAPAAKVVAGAAMSAPPADEPRRAPAAKPSPAEAPPAWRPVRVLHLSDLHFSAKTAWDSGTVLERLAKDVAGLRGAVGDIDLVVVTGDIATQGTAEEYERAKARLTGPLATAAGVTASAIRVVPGNHDVHRGSISRSASLLAKALLAEDDPQQAIAEVLGSEKERASLLERQAAFLTFAQTFHPGLAVPWWSERPVIRGLTVHLAGLNSAWLSASDADRGNLVLSRWQCHQLLTGADEADLTIALLHHPWDFFSELDQESEEELRRRCGVILHGHLHQQKARIASDPDRDVLQLAAGASYAGSKWANAYQLLELDPHQGVAKVHFRAWDGHDWIPDRNRYQKAPDGVATLPLRRSPKPPPPADDPTEDITDDPTPVRTDRDHYAALLKDQLNQLPDVFRVTDGPCTIAGIYVEVTLATSGRELDCAPDALHGQGREAALKFTASVDDLRGRVPLTDVLNHRHRRWGLLGDPGSGKTTLLRHVALELLNKPNGPLPIYLKVAELEHGLSPAITALCASFNAPQLAKHLLTEAQAGRAVLLIDGLDEAVDLPAARKWVAGAADLVGPSQVIVASRPIGYTEPSADFRTLTLCPLGAAEQAELLSRWVTDRAKVTAALERLSRTPRLHRLAENPLLLTLVGILLRAGHDVPSRRGDLYDLALIIMLIRSDDTTSSASPAAMSEPDLTLSLLGWAALRLHGQEGESYRRDALIAALEADPRNTERLGKHWPSPSVFVAEVAERTGLLIPDTGRVTDATAFSFPHRTFREFLAATALACDMQAGCADELTRVLAEGNARPEHWAEVLALTCGRLGPQGADTLLQRIIEQGGRTLLLRVVADAERISAETVRRSLKLEAGWKQEQLEARQKFIEEIPALVKDLAVAVGLLEQVARSTTCGHDLFWVREVLRRIERGEVKGVLSDGAMDDVQHAAKCAADNVLGHLDPNKRAELIQMLNPWWREIPAGSFDMGGGAFWVDDGGQPSLECGEQEPRHRVSFTSEFQILGVPVTWKMYRLFDLGHLAARDTFRGTCPLWSHDELPVYNVSWYAAVMFAEWVGARLPLEPEWEYACRAGTTTRYWSGDSEEDLARVGWVYLNSDGHPHPVGKKPKNAWGLHDVHGNVFEWCIDRWDEAAYVRRASGLTVHPAWPTYTVNGVSEALHDAKAAEHRVIRGGSWLTNWLLDASSANRNFDVTSHGSNVIGFRLVLTPRGRP